MLDVGTGSGNAAVEAARRGAAVSGVVLSPQQIEHARARCAAQGLAVDLSVGDAQDLGWPDASFDAVVSVMAVIFAPDHARAAAELARVTRPGGRVRSPPGRSAAGPRAGGRASPTCCRRPQPAARYPTNAVSPGSVHGA